MGLGAGWAILCASAFAMRKCAERGEILNATRRPQYEAVRLRAVTESAGTGQDRILLTCSCDPAMAALHATIGSVLPSMDGPCAALTRLASGWPATTDALCRDWRNPNVDFIKENQLCVHATVLLRLVPETEMLVTPRTRDAFHVVAGSPAGGQLSGCSL